MFTGNLSEKFEEPDMCFPIFPCITNWTLHNIHVTPKMVKMVIIVLYLAIWKSYESELLYIWGDLFYICLKESFYQNAGKCYLYFVYLKVFKRIIWLKAITLLFLFLLLVKSSKNMWVTSLKLTSPKNNCLQWFNN